MTRAPIIEALKITKLARKCEIEISRVTGLYLMEFSNDRLGGSGLCCS